MLKVVIFGVFDVFHDGHKFMLKSASTLGELHIILTTDKMVQVLKKRRVHDSYEKRKNNIYSSAVFASHTSNQVIGLHYRIYPSDEELGTYKELQKIDPDIVCFGYDQLALKEDLLKRLEQGKITLKSSIRFVDIEPYYPEQFKSSIILKELYSQYKSK